MTITPEEKKYFDYLNGLRDSGATNMFGATPYLMEKYDLSRSVARSTLLKWMENF